MARGYICEGVLIFVCGVCTFFFFKSTAPELPGTSTVSFEN